jgi:hypothetical protein
MIPNSIPEARKNGLVIEELEDELLVYDLERHKAHSLEQTAALVWHHCDGKTSVPETVAQLRKKFKIMVDDEVVWVAVRRLEKAHLLNKRVSVPAKFQHHSSRRELMQKLAVIGGLSIISILAPSAAQAASGPDTSCKHDTDKFGKEDGRCCKNGKGVCHRPSGTCEPQPC